jgi:septal ring factor EnvC (AmiA/AmiB activator)
MDNGTVPDSITATKTRGRPAAKHIDQRIAELTEKIAALRTQQSERQRKQTAELVRILGTAMMEAVNDNEPEACAVFERHIRPRVTRPAQRELVEMWLASQPTSTHRFISPESD